MHDGPEGHYHDIGDPIGGHDDIVVWITVGIDVGSSTSQIAFSRVTLERNDEHYMIAEREMLHQSEVILTPYKEEQTIDAAALARFVDSEYRAAGIAREQIDAGAVILTGLALATRNARAIADAVADDSGKFVSVTAGDMLEARLAASGAGVPNWSRESHDTLIHVDIGGGTTKLSCWRHGAPVSLAAIDVGARLITYDESRRITRIAEPCRELLAMLDAVARKRLRPNSPPATGGRRDKVKRIVDSGSLPCDSGGGLGRGQMQLAEGDTLDSETEESIAGVMAQQVLAHAGVADPELANTKLLRTSPLRRDVVGPVAVIFSGGVSEYVYGRESRTFGDLGMALGRAIRKAVDAAGVTLLPFTGGIRATVLGASQHTMQLSGSTVFVSDPKLLPLRNLPVVISRVDLSAPDLDRRAIEKSLRDSLSLRGENGKTSLAVAVTWHGSATYKRLSAVALALIAAVTPYLTAAAPLVVIAEGDVAGVLGSRLSQELADTRGVVCLDSIHVHEFDHIDIGQAIGQYADRTKALPVIVKSLLFAASAEQGSHHVGH